MHRIIRLGASVLLGFAALVPTRAAAVAPLPADSVYQLPLSLTDQKGNKLQWGDHRGQPMLVSMFYTSCEFVCPMLVEALNDAQAKLTPEQRSRMSVLLVTFDPERDTVAVLKRTAEQRELDPAHWTLARTDARSVRKLAAVLGIQYRALPNGDYNHTTALILLDGDGRIVGRSAQLGSADPVFVERIKAALVSVPR